MRERYESTRSVYVHLGLLIILGMCIAALISKLPEKKEASQKLPATTEQAQRLPEMTDSIVLTLPACEDVQPLDELVDQPAEGVSCLMYDDLGSGAQLYLFRWSGDPKPLAVTDLPESLKVVLMGTP